MWEGGDLARPELPRPSCRVKLVCGPPAAGKSTYVQAHKGADDIVIDWDLIAEELGFDRASVKEFIPELLEERNARLAALAEEPATRVAWVVLTAPSKALRRWWCEMLNVRSVDLVVLVPPRAELYRRIMADPARTMVRKHNLEFAAQWFIRERNNDPGVLRQGFDARGNPTDPLHPWNVRQSD
jgi:hypothetical protein